jgi:hypothetical protein
VIPENLLDLVKCISCNKPFKSRDSVISIVSSFYDEGYKDFIACTVNVGESDGIVSVFKRISFHRECFIVLAGEEWTP